MCPRVSVSQWHLGDMNIRTFFRISKYFPYAKVVYLSGWGEPLLNKNILDMIKIAKEAKCSVGFTTNGMLLTEELSKELIKLRVDMIGVSIDGANPETYESIRVGAEFNKLIENVRTLNAVKEKMRSSKPEVVFTFLMMKKNINELPSIIDLAYELKVDRVVATNLDCTMKLLDEELHLFSCNNPKRSFIKMIEEAKVKAEKYNIQFYAYPIKMKPTVLCSADPLRNIFFTWDGRVTPCVYTGIPIKEGFIPRIFCGKEYKIPRLSFGSIINEDLFEIWKMSEYQEFRGHFRSRENLYSLAKFRTLLDQSFEEKLNIENKKKKLQLPKVCKTCYKAYGI